MVKLCIKRSCINAGLSDLRKHCLALINKNAITGRHREKSQKNFSCGHVVFDLIAEKHCEVPIPSGFRTTFIPDRETFSDSHLTTPLSQQALAFQQGFNQAYDNDGIYPDLDPETQPGDAQGISSSSLAYTSGSSLPVFYRDLPGQRGFEHT